MGGCVSEGRHGKARRDTRRYVRRHRGRRASVRQTGHAGGVEVRRSKVQIHQAVEYESVCLWQRGGNNRRGRADGTFRGHPIEPKLVFTDTFVLQDGTWKAAASHRITAPK